MASHRAQRKNVTLKDVAEATGYSINTVSRALRSKDDISEETRLAICQTAQDMGYVNNTLAASLRLGYTKTIAVIVGDISNPHFAIMTKEIEKRCTVYGYSAFLLNTNEDKDDELRAIRTAINKNVDGMIICPCQETADNIQFLIDSHIPFVEIGRHEEELQTSYVICNDVMGGYQATQWLIQNGHRRILFLNAPEYISSSRERLAGYKKALEEAGIPYDPALVRTISLKEDNLNEVMDQVKSDGPEYTAVFAFSDMKAWEVWSWLLRNGKDVPADCSLIGFDHIQSRMPVPHQLATISSYKAKMSITAVDNLMNKINPEKNPDADCNDMFCSTIQTALIQGETVKKVQ